MGTRTETLNRPATRRRVPLVPLGVLSDAALARRVAEGDQRAFEQLYSRYRDQLFRYCAALVRRSEDAEDALQAAMTNAYRALDRGDGVGEMALRAWLYRIAHNECVNILRRRVVNEELTGAEAAIGDGVADQVERAAEVRQLTADLATLPPRPRSALILRELSGLSHEEIGQALGGTASVAKQLIYEARAGLEELEEGRSMPCTDVRRTISDGDRRALRGRRLNAHLRACAGCRAFRERLDSRPRVLASVVPGALPALAGQRILEAVLGSAATAGVGGGMAAAGAGAALSGAASTVGVKVAAVASAGVLAGAGVVAGPALVRHATPAPVVRTSHVHTSAAPAGSGLPVTAGASWLLTSAHGNDRPGRAPDGPQAERRHPGLGRERAHLRSVHQPLGRAHGQVKGRPLHRGRAGSPAETAGARGRGAVVAHRTAATRPAHRGASTRMVTTAPGAGHARQALRAAERVVPRGEVRRVGATTVGASQRIRRATGAAGAIRTARAGRTARVAQGTAARGGVAAGRRAVRAAEAGTAVPPAVDTQPDAARRVR